MSSEIRRRWWLLGQSPPGAVAATIGSASFSVGMIGMTLRDGLDGSAFDGFYRVFLWFFVLCIPAVVVGGVASVITLRRHPELVRWPAAPMRPGRARVCWTVGTALALVGLLGLAPIVRALDGPMRWVPFIAAVAAQWVLLTLSMRLGRWVPADAATST